MTRILAHDFNTKDVSDINILVAALQTQIANRKESIASYQAEIAANTDGKVDSAKHFMAMVFSAMCQEGELLDRLFLSKDGIKSIPLGLSQQQTASFFEAVRREHNPELANEQHVTQFWYDGEITDQKGGDLLWQRTIRCVEQGFIGLNFPAEQWPCQLRDKGYIFCTREAANELRDWLLEQLILNLLS